SRRARRYRRRAGLGDTRRAAWQWLTRAAADAAPLVRTVDHRGNPVSRLVAAVSFAAAAALKPRPHRGLGGPFHTPVAVCLFRIAAAERLHQRRGGGTCGKLLRDLRDPAAGRREPAIVSGLKRRPS